MPHFPEIAWAKYMRESLVRLPPYTLNTMPESKAKEAAAREAEHLAGFVQRNEQGVSASRRFDLHPTASLIPPESRKGRIVSAQA